MGDKAESSHSNEIGYNFLLLLGTKKILHP